MLSHLDFHWKDLFFEKAEDWRDEQEYRWVFFDEANRNLSFEIWDSLMGIILGSEFDQDQWEWPLFDYKKSHGLEYEKLNWRNGVPEMYASFIGKWK